MVGLVNLFIWLIEIVDYLETHFLFEIFAYTLVLFPTTFPETAVKYFMLATITTICNFNSLLFNSLLPTEGWGRLWWVATLLVASCLWKLPDCGPVSYLLGLSLDTTKWGSGAGYNGSLHACESSQIVSQSIVCLPFCLL